MARRDDWDENGKLLILISMSFVREETATPATVRWVFVAVMA